MVNLYEVNCSCSMVNSRYRLNIAEELKLMMDRLKWMEEVYLAMDEATMKRALISIGTQMSTRTIKLAGINTKTHLYGWECLKIDSTWKNQTDVASEEGKNVYRSSRTMLNDSGDETGISCETTCGTKKLRCKEATPHETMEEPNFIDGCSW